MKLRKLFYASALTLAAAVSGCSSASPCTANDCPSDVAITIRVRAL